MDSFAHPLCHPFGEAMILSSRAALLDALFTHQVAMPRLAVHYFARGCDFESLGDSFFRFAAAHDINGKADH